MTPIEKVRTIYEKIEVICSDIPIANSGLTEIQIIDTFKNIDLSPPHFLIELYQWHNGAYDFVSLINFLPLNEALLVYKRFEEFKTDMPYWGWQYNWFPILDINNDVQVCIDLESGALISIDLEIDKIEIIAEHYTKYLDALLYIFEQKLFYYDEDYDLIAVTYKVWADIRAKYQISNAW